MDWFNDFLICKICKKYFYTQTVFQIHINEEHQLNSLEEACFTKTEKKENLFGIIKKKETIYEEKDAKLNPETELSLNITNQTIQYRDTLHSEYITTCEGHQKTQIKSEDCQSEECQKDETKSFSLVEEHSNNPSEEENLDDVYENAWVGKAQTNVKKENFPEEFKTQLGNCEKIIKPYQCSQCDKSFVYKKSVKHHTISVHDKIKPVQCDLCQKTFRDKFNVKCHIETVHKKIKSFHCQQCDKSFSQKKNLKGHIEAVHEKIIFKCLQCNNSYTDKRYLQGHIKRVHEKIKSFQCHICKKAFGYGISMKRHIQQVHNKIKSFQCHICKKAFGYDSSLKRHVQQHHNKI